MHRSKQLAAGFLLGALVVGGVLGFTADRMMVADRLAPPWGASHRTMRDHLASELGLTPSQRAQLDTILDAKHRQIDAVLEPLRPRLDAIGDTARTQITRMLDERQRTVFERMHRDMLARRKEEERR